MFKVICEGLVIIGLSSIFTGSIAHNIPWYVSAGFIIVGCGCIYLSMKIAAVVGQQQLTKK
jgi:hypothetical protein